MPWPEDHRPGSIPDLTREGHLGRDIRSQVVLSHNVSHVAVHQFAGRRLKRRLAQRQASPACANPTEGHAQAGEPQSSSLDKPHRSAKGIVGEAAAEEALDSLLTDGLVEQLADGLFVLAGEDSGQNSPKPSAE